MHRVQIQTDREGKPGATFTLTIDGVKFPRQMTVAQLRELAHEAKGALAAHEWARTRAISSY